MTEKKPRKNGPSAALLIVKQRLGNGTIVDVSIAELDGDLALGATKIRRRRVVSQTEHDRRIGTGLVFNPETGMYKISQKQ